MIEMVMLVALGFLIGCLVALIFARPFWRRTVVMTRHKVETTLPTTLSEMQADKDLLRAEFALKVQRLETIAEKAREKEARQLIQANKRRATVSTLEREVAALKRRLQELENANFVLSETVDRRLPDLEAQMQRNNADMAANDAELEGFKRDYATQTAALSAAREETRRRAEELERLRLAMTADPRNADDPRRLNAELSRLREELQRRKQIEAQETADLMAEIQRLADQIMEGPARPHLAEVTQLPRPPLDVVEPTSTESEAEKPSSPSSRIRALRRIGQGGGRRGSLTERLGTIDGD